MAKLSIRNLIPFLLLLIFVILGCTTTNHVSKANYQNNMQKLANQLADKGKQTIYWPYGDDATLVYKIGNRGDNSVNKDFYIKLEHIEAEMVYSEFVSARHNSGYSSGDAKKCTVLVSDDIGKVLSHADSGGVYLN